METVNPLPHRHTLHLPGWSASSTPASLWGLLAGAGWGISERLEVGDEGGGDRLLVPLVSSSFNSSSDPLGAFLTPQKFVFFGFRFSSRLRKIDQVHNHIVLEGNPPKMTREKVNLPQIGQRAK